MLTADSNMNRWKNEQLSYFKEYLKSFKPGSRQHKEILRGIRDLEGVV